MGNNKTITLVIEYYLGRDIDFIEIIDSIIYFGFDSELGLIEEDSLGNWILKLNGSEIAMIEYCIVDLVLSAGDVEDIELYYRGLIKLLSKELSPKSIKLVGSIMISTEEIMIQQNVPIDKPISIGKYFLFNLNGIKEVVCLN